jgi:hypothetical protein
VMRRALMLGVAVLVAATAHADGRIWRTTVAGGQVVSEGLKPMPGPGGEDIVTATTFEGVGCFAATAPKSWWLRLLLTEALPKDHRGPVTIGIRYFDNEGPISTQFDSSDPTRMVGGAWAWGATLWRGKSQTWKTAYWTIEKPGFTHREYGTDFAISGQTNRGYDPLYISEVTVSLAGAVLTSDVPGLALGDQRPAKLTARVFGPDGDPAPDGTKVRFAATLGECTPVEAMTVGGEAATTFVPGDNEGEAMVGVVCDFSSGLLTVPLVRGTGGVRVVEWPVDDFEAPNAAKIVECYARGAVRASLRVCPEAAHSGNMGAEVTYAYTGEGDSFDAGVSHVIPLPGVLLGLSFWAQRTELKENRRYVETRWAIRDAEDENWSWLAVAHETDAPGWTHYSSSVDDPMAPNRNAVRDYPLSFAGVVVSRRRWSFPEAGTLYVDDIMARLLVSNSEADKLTRKP